MGPFKREKKIPEAWLPWSHEAWGDPELPPEKKRSRSSHPLLHAEGRKGQHMPHFMKPLETKELNARPIIAKKGKQSQQDPVDDQNLCITIPLKGGVPPQQPGKQDLLSQDFLRAIQDEYATRYLELMKIVPSQKNKTLLLSRKPLTSCEIVPIQNSSSWLADQIQIYPNRLKKKTFENTREEFLQKKLQEKYKDDQKIEKVCTFDDPEDSEHHLGLERMKTKSKEIKTRREKLMQDAQNALQKQEAKQEKEEQIQPSETQKHF